MLKISKKYVPIIAAALLFLHIAGIINADINTENNEKSIVVLNEIDDKPILIIDAGHGGADGGAIAPDGTVESGINLSIALKLNNLAKVFGVDTILTREYEELDYPEGKLSIAEMKRWDQKQRLELINSFSNAVLISIHQNKYPDSRPFGPQVLYGKAYNSDILGKSCHELLNCFLCPKNRRVAVPAPDNIYLIKNANCASILVECGFLSNHDDFSKLCDNAYQNKIAAIILYAYLNQL